MIKIEVNQAAIDALINETRLDQEGAEELLQNVLNLCVVSEGPDPDKRSEREEREGEGSDDRLRKAAQELILEVSFVDVSPLRAEIKDKLLNLARVLVEGEK